MNVQYYSLPNYYKFPKIYLNLSKISIPLKRDWITTNRNIYYRIIKANANPKDQSSGSKEKYRQKLNLTMQFPFLCFRAGWWMFDGHFRWHVSSHNPQVQEFFLPGAIILPETRSYKMLVQDALWIL